MALVGFSSNSEFAKWKIIKEKKAFFENLIRTNKVSSITGITLNRDTVEDFVYNKDAFSDVTILIEKLILRHLFVEKFTIPARRFLIGKGDKIAEEIRKKFNEKILKELEKNKENGNEV